MEHHTQDKSESRVNNVFRQVSSSSLNGLKYLKLADIAAAYHMAVRILNRLRSLSINDHVVDAQIALFIALKTECIVSPMDHSCLVAISGVTWDSLQEREIQILTDISWRLYEGALGEA